MRFECPGLSGRQWAGAGSAVWRQLGRLPSAPGLGEGRFLSAALCMIRILLFCFIRGREALMRRIGC